MNNEFNVLKEKILCNLDKICLDPIGYFASAELMKNQTFSGWHETAEAHEKGLYKIKDKNGEEINLLHNAKLMSAFNSSS